ncbi:MAG: CoA-binding protein, partial [Kamptonema sp. SIO4C4]|nr:CoA-binding protein [Kamptonema sp. SIO4C4]
NIVAGVSVGQGGHTIHDIPVFDLVEQAIQDVGQIDTTLIFVPPYMILDAALEAIAAGIQQLILIPAGIPPLDVMQLLHKTQNQDILILGGGSAGVLIPGKVLLGTMNPHRYKPGNVAILSRTDPQLTDEVAHILTQAEIGQSIVVHWGTSDIIGANFTDWFKALAKDPETEAIVLLEQSAIGNEAAAAAIPKNYSKPIVAYIAGQEIPVNSIPQDSATLIASQLSEPFPHTSTASEKIAVCKKAKIPVAKSPHQLAELLNGELKKQKKSKD